MAKLAWTQGRLLYSGGSASLVNLARPIRINRRDPSSNWEGVNIHYDFCTGVVKRNVDPLARHNSLVKYLEADRVEDVEPCICAVSNDLFHHC